MIRPLITIPEGLFRLIDFNWDIDWRSDQVGADLGGGEATMFTQFPRWVGSPTIFLHDSAIRRWQAIRWHARGIAGVYRVSICNPLVSKTQGPKNGVPFSTGERFSTGQGFSYEPFFTVVGNVSAGAEELTISLSGDTPPPVMGQIVSDGNDWPIGITSVTQTSGTRYLITVQPFLRAAIANGSQLALKAYGRFTATSDTMGNPQFGANRVSRPTLEFREYLGR